MKSWYLIAYDIRDQKRLRKLHYRLKKQAIAMQYSVFLIKANDTTLAKLLDTISSVTRSNEDDVRLYAVFNPNTIWTAGRQADTIKDLYSGGKELSPARSGWLQKTLDKITGEPA